MQPHLTPSGIFFGILVAWWLVASAMARTIEVVAKARQLLRAVLSDEE
jgi:hypothetical protein